jgi:hypothetical protein
MSRRAIEDVLVEHTGDKNPTAKAARKAADEITSRADRFGSAAVSSQLRADATRLVEYASSVDLAVEQKRLGIGESNTPTKSAPAEQKASKATGTKQAAAKRGTRSRTTATRSALREAIVPDRQIAGGIRKTASTAWSIVAGGVFLIVVYLLVTKGARSVGAIRELENIARAAIYPPAAFPYRYPTTARKAIK